MPDINAVINEALELAPVQRAELIESLLASFDSQRAEIDKLWANEAERRIDAHDQGKLKASSADEVFSRIEQQK
ncbi:putative addiction module component, TIGR02574 family [Paucidesulfovibrio gracilis DSM 16080]|uniref:Putative addiction module component, TIGR02574 family n=1 Tax=Paucidesulfovibrio gracilis DSM 16080 TaxID=1121449 RepID=A0A1T4W3F0_9BACT|nr:addiction module protein [Paucidesulfovibrio gracilis]SKA71251.1 putative addiction module component, TIGR02574 family [Paucidesulfovibrio gracilis DSM 16080]